MLPGKFPVALSEGENNNIMMFLDNSAGNSITILKLNSNFEVL
jgi:hypothetical protein